ncbi:MAG TPA: alpha/beta hydrolase, partial [Dehalococcoidia bacterium]|nr:alpha/beta hydrolase [Dehalococcoidia bacterium]
MAHELPTYERLIGLIGAGRQTVQFDTRGVGLSQREVSGATAEDIIRDAEAVIDAIGAGRVSMFANGPLGGLALRYAATRPDQVSCLVVFGTLIRIASRSWYEAIIHMARGNWDMAARMIAGGQLRHGHDEASQLARIYLESTSGDIVAAYLENSLDLDFADDVRKISAPTLVIHSREDSMYPFSHAQELAALIKDSRLLPLDGNRSATSLGDMTGRVAKAIDSFLDESPETRAIPHGMGGNGDQRDLRTVLFTDLVGHTEMMSRLGDERGRAVLREHERITREVLAAYGGTEVKSMGDGFMASFGSV